MSNQPVDDNWPRQGDVYWIDFDPVRGSEQGGKRPCVVISIDGLNRRSSTCVVAAITKTDLSRLRSVLELPAGQPTEKRSFVLPTQVVTIDNSRLEKWIGQLTATQIDDLKDRLRMVWGL